MSGIHIDDGVNSSSVYGHMSPTEPLVLFMYLSRLFSINVSLPCIDIGQEYAFIFSSRSDDIFNIESNSSMLFMCEKETNGDKISGLYTNMSGIINRKVEISLQGNLIGISELIIEIKGAEFANTDINGTYLTVTNNHEQHSASHSHGSSPKMVDVSFPVSTARNVRYKIQFPVTVLRKLRPIDNIFRYLMTVFLFLITMAFGCKLDLGIVKECLKKPVAPGIGFGCQYLIMPLLGFAIAKLLPLGADKSVALGIFVCGVCPGGGLSNIYTYLLDGDVSLSITMTFLSTVASIGMMPLWIYTLGQLFMDDDYSISIPYVNMVQIIALITVPLLFGIVIKYKFLKVAVRILKILKPVTLVGIVLFMTIGLYSNLFIFKLFRPLHIVAGCLLPYLGYILGGVIAAVFKQPSHRVKTIALETGMQNVGVAFLLMISSFPPPYGDLASVAPLASALMTPFPPFIVTIVYLIYKKCCKDYQQLDLEEPEVKVGSGEVKVGSGEVKVDAGEEMQSNDGDQALEQMSTV